MPVCRKVFQKFVFFFCADSIEIECGKTRKSWTPNIRFNFICSFVETIEHGKYLANMVDSKWVVQRNGHCKSKQTNSMESPTAREREKWWIEWCALHIFKSIRKIYYSIIAANQQLDVRRNGTTAQNLWRIIHCVYWMFVGFGLWFIDMFDSWKDRIVRITCKWWRFKHFKQITISNAIWSMWR